MSLTKQEIILVALTVALWLIFLFGIDVVH